MVSSKRNARLGLGAAGAVLCLCLGILGAKAIEHQRQMASMAPQFQAMNLAGDPVSLDSFKGKIIVLFFYTIRCPVSGEYAPRFVNFAKQFAGNDTIRFMCIETTLRKDDPETVNELRVYKRVVDQKFPILLDGQGEVVKKYSVKVTPTVVVIDEQGRIRYSGAFDDNRDESKVTKRYCADAVEEVMAGRTVATGYTQAFGCPIWQPK